MRNRVSEFFVVEKPSSAETASFPEFGFDVALHCRIPESVKIGMEDSKLVYATLLLVRWRKPMLLYGANGVWEIVALLAQEGFRMVKAI